MIGTTLAHYRITAKLGEGGMGAVYRATDARLNREVAIKVLPEAFAQDAARMQRFEREAQVLASLNHPNIAAIYGVEPNAIVMELIEGEDLKGPLPVETALNYARQIAVALEAAHDKGVIHRDLKPANIKVASDGVVKLLDFGLAKSAEGPPPAPGTSPTMSPTVALGMTEAGTILGTADYMPPEQARGKAVDRRADIWAYGVVLFEMLTGRPLFGGGETVSDALAAVITKDPDWAALPPDTPPRVRRLLERCLRKDPKQRLRDIGEARLILDEGEPASAAAPPAAGWRGGWLPWAVAGLALAGAGAAWLRPKNVERGPGTVRFLLPFPEGNIGSGSPAAPQAVPSPDGRYVALIARDRESSRECLWIRALDSVSPRRLEKTEGANLPFWSPDSQFLGFFADEKLKRVPVSGGPVQTLCEVHASFGSNIAGDGGTWNSDGVIVFGAHAQPLRRISAAGGTLAPVTAVEKDEVWHSWPQFLPDGRHILYFALGKEGNKSAIYVQAMGSSTRTLVARNTTRGVWSPPGYLLFVREGTLFAQRMDPATFQLTGEPLAVAQDVTVNEINGRSAFAVSENGVLAYRGGTLGRARQLTWFDRAGKVVGLVGQPSAFLSLTLSPDERSTAVIIGTPGKADAWVVDMASGVFTRLTQDSRVTPTSLAWSPDSQRLAVSADGGGIREFTLSTGAPRMLTQAQDDYVAEAYTPDGRSLLVADRKSNRLSLLPLVAGSAARTILDTRYRKNLFSFSPDGQFVVYCSDETGRFEVWVASFPSFGVKRRLTDGGGANPMWSKDGKEIFFRSSDGVLTSVDLRAGATIEAGVPKPLFKWGFGALGNHFGISAGGQRFLVSEPEQKDFRALVDYTLVLNWLAELKGR